MDNSNKPDLEENTNVRVAHREVDREAAASAREMNVRENGLEPVSSKVIIALVLVALIAGGVLFKDELSNFGETPAGYMRGEDPAGGVKGPPLGKAYDVYYAKGAEIFSGNCASCHGGDGAGGTAAPPLKNSEWTANSTHLLAIVKNGVKGPIDVNGTRYEMSAMPAIGASMDDFQLAALATYLGNSFGHSNGEVVTLEQAADIKKRLSGRAPGAVTANELNTDARFKGELKGTRVEKDAIVNKKTGELN